MSKGKQRHNPDKPANRRDTHCPYYEDIEGRGYCSALMGAIPTDPKCNGGKGFACDRFSWWSQERRVGMTHYEWMLHQAAQSQQETMDLQ